VSEVGIDLDGQPGFNGAGKQVKESRMQRRLAAVFSALWSCLFGYFVPSGLGRFQFAFC
jgi:hypothetical protein